MESSDPTHSPHPHPTPQVNHENQEKVENEIIGFSFVEENEAKEFYFYVLECVKNPAG